MSIRYNGAGNRSEYLADNIDATKQLSFSIWLNKDGTAAGRRAFHLHKTGGIGFQIAMDFDGGSRVNVASSQATGTWGVDTAGRLRGDLSSLVWNHVCGTVSVNDGSGNKTLESAFLNGVALTDTGGDTFFAGTAQSDIFVGARTDDAQTFDGMLAEAAVWEDVQITLEEAKALASGAPVTSIQAQALVFYTPQHQDEGVDLITGNAGSVTAATPDEHPPVTIAPSPIFVPIAAAPVSGRIMSSLANAGGLAGFGGIAGQGGGLAG